MSASYSGDYDDGDNEEYESASEGENRVNEEQRILEQIAVIDREINPVMNNYDYGSLVRFKALAIERKTLENDLAQLRRNRRRRDRDNNALVVASTSKV